MREFLKRRINRSMFNTGCTKTRNYKNHIAGIEHTDMMVDCAFTNCNPATGRKCHHLADATAHAIRQKDFNINDYLKTPSI